MSPRLLRRLHDASASFVPPHDAHWFADGVQVGFPADVPAEPPADLVSHFDVTPQNVVFRDGEPVALIDFDLAGPGSRLRDVVDTAMWWVPLFERNARNPAFQAVDAPSRLASFVEAYGLEAVSRKAFCELAIDGATRSWHAMRANAEQRGGWARMWEEGVGDRILRRRQWLLEERAALEAALRRDQAPPGSRPPRWQLPRPARLVTFSAALAAASPPAGDEPAHRGGDEVPRLTGLAN